TARSVDDLSLGGGEEPRFGIVGRAAARPSDERRGERIGQRILRPRHVARVRRKQSDETPITLARDALGEVRLAHRTMTGLSSTPPPCSMVGACLAQFSASA